MKHFCLGFLFDPDQEKVLLLSKRASDHYNPSKWNGIGGRVEKNESGLEAIVRECQEEAGLRVDEPCWDSLGVLTDNETFKVEVFAAMAYLDAAYTTTDEVIRIFDRETAKNLDFAKDVDLILKPWFDGKKLVNEVYDCV